MKSAIKSLLVSALSIAFFLGAAEACADTTGNEKRAVLNQLDKMDLDKNVDPRSSMPRPMDNLNSAVKNAFEVQVKFEDAPFDLCFRLTRSLKPRLVVAIAF